MIKSLSTGEFNLIRFIEIIDEINDIELRNLIIVAMNPIIENCDRNITGKEKLETLSGLTEYVLHPKIDAKFSLGLSCPEDLNNLPKDQVVGIGIMIQELFTGLKSETIIDGQEGLESNILKLPGDEESKKALSKKIADLMDRENSTRPKAVFEEIQALLPKLTEEPQKE